MKTLKDYLTEAEEWSATPAVGDTFAFDYGDQCLVETHIVDVVGNNIILHADARAIELLESHGFTSEEIRRYGAVGNSPGIGYSIGEDQSAGVLAAKEIDTDITNPMPGVHESLDDETSPAERAILHRILMQHSSLLGRHGPQAVMDAVKDVAEWVGDVEEIGSSDVSGWVRDVIRTLDNSSDQVKESNIDVVDSGEYDQEGDMAKDDLETIIRAARRLTGMLDDNENMPEWVQSKITKAADYVDTAADYVESNKEPELDEGWKEKLGAAALAGSMALGAAGAQARVTPDGQGGFTGGLKPTTTQQATDVAPAKAEAPKGFSKEYLQSVVDGKHPRPMVSVEKAQALLNQMNEAEYQGRNVPLGKPMRGDSKKFKVYVKDPSTGNIKKVNFGHGGTSAKRAGQKTMKIKKSDPARRKSFRARHNCENPGPRTKARYWSCRAW